MYHSMFDENIAQAIASKDGFGLSDIIVKSLYKESEQEESVPDKHLPTIGCVQCDEFELFAAVYRKEYEDTFGWN